MCAYVSERGRSGSKRERGRKIKYHPFIFHGGSLRALVGRADVLYHQLEGRDMKEQFSYQMPHHTLEASQYKIADISLTVMTSIRISYPPQQLEVAAGTNQNTNKFPSTFLSHDVPQKPAYAFPACASSMCARLCVNPDSIVLCHH